jgi:D-tyrosyl-tRNA(Tyr) deacylase
MLIPEEEFVDEIPEDEFAREEIVYGARAKCPVRGKRDKFTVKVSGDRGEELSRG